MTPAHVLVRSSSSLETKTERRLDAARFRLSHDFARLVSSSSSLSSKSTRTVSTHGSRAVPEDYENEPHSGLPLHPVDFDPHDMSHHFSDSPPHSLSRRAKFYGFLSRSSSHSRSRSNGDIRPSDSGSNGSPDMPNATTTSTSVTSDSHMSAPNPLTSRPLSNNTSTTGETVTPKNIHALTGRAIPVHAINDSGIGVDKYHPLMPPPPVPGPSTVSQPTSSKEKRRSKQLFGLAAAHWSRPTTPKDEQVPLPSPPQTPRSRPSKVSKIENWFKLGTSSSATPSSSRPVIAAPQARRPTTSSSVRPDPADACMRPHSTPPRTHRDSSGSERDGRCSPLMGLFTSTRGRGKQREREQSQERQTSRSRKPVVVGAPMMRTRTASREGQAAVAKTPGGGPLPSFDFERGASAEVRRSASHNGHRRVVATHGHHSNGNGHAHTTHRARGHAHSNSLDMRTRGLAHGHSHSHHRHTHARSPSTQAQAGHAHPPRSHTHPQPNHQQRGATSPHSPLPPHSPPLSPPNGASAASQSTAGTGATNTTTGAAAAVAGGTGSWGRVARTIDWVRGVGVHPPFAFESAASSTASERRGDIRERERDRDRERSRRHVAQPQLPPSMPSPPAPASPAKSNSMSGSGTGTGAGHWEQREVELGLGLSWAPSKIRVREWTPGGTIPAAAVALGAAPFAGVGDMERRAEYEMGYNVRSRSRSRKDKEVTGRFREVLGAEGFEAFKKYVRRFDADIIPLEGAAGLLGRVGRLLDKAPTRLVDAREKREMLDDLVRIVRESEW